MVLYFSKTIMENIVIIYEVKEESILDFMEIEGKENSFILCGNENAFITNDKKILNKNKFDESDQKFWNNADYI